MVTAELSHIGPVMRKGFSFRDPVVYVLAVIVVYDIALDEWVHRVNRWNRKCAHNHFKDDTHGQHDVVTDDTCSRSQAPLLLHTPVNMRIVFQRIGTRKWASWHGFIQKRHTHTTSTVAKYHCHDWVRLDPSCRCRAQTRQNTTFFNLSIYVLRYYNSLLYFWPDFCMMSPSVSLRPNSIFTHRNCAGLTWSVYILMTSQSIVPLC